MQYIAKNVGEKLLQLKRKEKSLFLQFIKSNRMPPRNNFEDETNHNTSLSQFRSVHSLPFNIVEHFQMKYYASMQLKGQQNHWKSKLNVQKKLPHPWHLRPFSVDKYASHAKHKAILFRHSNVDLRQFCSPLKCKNS